MPGGGWPPGGAITLQQDAFTLPAVIIPIAADSKHCFQFVNAPSQPFTIACAIATAETVIAPTSASNPNKRAPFKPLETQRGSPVIAASAFFCPVQLSTNKHTQQPAIVCRIICRPQIACKPVKMPPVCRSTASVDSLSTHKRKRLRTHFRHEKKAAVFRQRP